jgi:hypothetical protein
MEPFCEPPWPLVLLLGEPDRRLLVLLGFGFALVVPGEVLCRDRTTRNGIITPREEIAWLVKRGLGGKG